jgi:ABC-type lipoprotein export system ATPase subunit
VTVVLVTHDTKVAALAPRVIRVEDGKISSDTRRASQTEITAAGLSLAWEASA